MDTTELTDAMRRATAGLEPPPGFTAAVLRAGRRRAVRRRAVIATGVAAVTAISGTGTYVLWPEPVPVTQAADPRLTQPTHGDLAGDRAFLNATASAWRQGLVQWNAADLRGQPHVYWAGTTPAGPAAVVMQQYLQSTGDLMPDDPDRMGLLVGLVATDPADGRRKLVYESYEPFTHPNLTQGYFQFGPGDRTILITDRGSQLWFSPAAVTDPTGRATRDWQPLPVRDGVAIAQVPENGRASDARVLARPARPAPDEKDMSGMLLLEPASRYLALAAQGFPTIRPAYPRTDVRLRWFDEAAQRMRVGSTTWPVPEGQSAMMDLFLDGLQRAGVPDLGNRSRGFGGWAVIAGLADGRVAIVSEYVEDEKPSNIYALLLDQNGSMIGLVPGGRVDASVPLPVRLRLPDGQGWVVADYGAALRYRVTPGGPWQDAGRNAALLPDNTIQVEVTRNGGVPVEVGLG